MAVATRKECKDAVSVYGTEQWNAICSFPTATLDLAALTWSPDGASILVQDTRLRYRLLVYSPTGDLVARYQAYEHALGVRATSWSPDGSCLAVGSFDQVVRLLNPLSWRVVTEFTHAQPKLLPRASLSAETSALVEEAPGQYTTATDLGTLTLGSVKVDSTKLVPKVGVGLMAWSHDGNYLVTRDESMPTVLWIWDTSGLCQLLVQLEPVRSVKWAPGATALAFGTGGGQLYFWTPAEGVRAVELPAEGQCTGLQWGADGSYLCVSGKTVAFACAVGVE